MKKRLFWLGWVVGVLSLFSILSAEEVKRGDWLIGVFGGPEENSYSYEQRYFSQDWEMLTAQITHKKKYFSRGLFVEYSVRNDFSLALKYSEAEARTLWGISYGPPNTQGWYQVLTDIEHICIKEIGFSGSYHLTFLHVKNLDPMLTAGIKGSWIDIILPVYILDFSEITESGWSYRVLNPNYNCRYITSWLSIGCRYWFFHKLAVGCHYQIDFLLSQKNIENDTSYFFNDFRFDRKDQGRVYFEVVVKL